MECDSSTDSSRCVSDVAQPDSTSWAERLQVLRDVAGGGQPRAGYDEPVRVLVRRGLLQRADDGRYRLTPLGVVVLEEE